MKKYLFVLGFTVILLSGCKQPEIEKTSVIQTDGVYNYIKGKTTVDIKSVSLKTQNGTEYKGQFNEDEFLVNSPALLSDENVSVFLTFDNDKSVEKNYFLKKRIAIDDYSNFAKNMNLVIANINENAKTKFPTSQSDGVAIIGNENGVTTNINVQDGQLVGINLSSAGDSNKEMATIISAFQGNYNANNNGVAEAYNNTLESKKESSFSSNGFNFSFMYNGDDLTTDITREE